MGSPAALAQANINTNPGAQQKSAPAPMQSLSEVADPTTTLVADPVKDVTGTPIGDVRSVKMTADLKVTAVDVTLRTQENTGKAVSIDASKFRFDPNNSVLETSLSLSQIQKLPAAQ
ncbi:MAG TPA: hypothetical protein VMD53_19845 [Rhizomicrobium sp.]|nr:hypothetical protein [Rhizomicrobium sp.]